MGFMGYGLLQSRVLQFAIFTSFLHETVCFSWPFQPGCYHLAKSSTLNKLKVHGGEGFLQFVQSPVAGSCGIEQQC